MLTLGPSSRKDYISYYLSSLHYIVNFGNMITHQSWISCKNPIVPVFSLHILSVCVTGILSLVTFDDIICDYGILDIISSSLHDLPDFFLCDPLHVFHEICFRSILSHIIGKVLLTPNIININIIIFHHVLHKMVTNINVIGIRTNLPILLQENLSFSILVYNQRLLQFNNFFK